MRTKVWSVTCALVAACAGAPNEAPFSPSGPDAGVALDSGTNAGAKAQPKSGAAGSSGRPSADAGAMPAARPRDAAQAMPDADMNTNMGTGMAMGMGIDIDAGSTHDAGTMPDPAVETLHSHADILLQTLMLRFWPTLSANTSVYDWMYAHYWDAVLDATERRGKHAFAATARMFFELQKQRGWFDDFYDDENWVTLALLHAHTVTGEAMYLEQARAVFADIEKAWDESCCGEHKGGLFWKKPAENKVTAINAGAVISAARLYEATHEAAYLDSAKKAYAFWSQTMVDPKSGHVYDGFDNAGTINKAWRFTYNEGLFIGAIVALVRATGDDSQLPLAHKVAAFMLREESAVTPLGSILSDGKCSGDGEMFKAVAARYLGELYALDRSHAGMYQVELRYASVEDASRSLSVNGGASVAMSTSTAWTY